MFNVTDDFKITGAVPDNGSANVPLNNEISVYFSQPVDAATLNTGTFIVARNSATPIAGSVRYEVAHDGRYVGIFTPQVILQPQTTYQVTLVGISHPMTGGSESVIKSVLGVTLGRNYSLVFSTGAVSLQPPVVELPIEYSSITDVRPVFQWNLMTGATSYQIEIGSSELMDPLYTPPGGDLSYPIVVPGDVDNYRPEQVFEAGRQYFWRIRSTQGIIMSTWSPLYSFYIMNPGEDPPYAPDTPEPFVPSGDTTFLFGGQEEFHVMSVEPGDTEMNVKQDYIKIHYNKAIDPDSIDSGTFSVTILGTKVMQSDPNVREPGKVAIETVYVDDDDPTTLVIIPVGAAGPEGTRPMQNTGRVGEPTIRQYENMFKDVLGRSGFRYGYGKHFMDKTERFAPDDLYTDVHHGQLRIGKHPAYPIVVAKSTVVGLDFPVQAEQVQIQARYSVPLSGTFAFEISMDGAMTWTGVTFVYDATRDLQLSQLIGVPRGNKLRARITMATGNAQETPVLEWFMVVFNEVR